MRLTEHDKMLIGQLKAEREKALMAAKSLRDVDIAKKFDCHHRTVERIPAWPSK